MTSPQLSQNSEYKWSKQPTHDGFPSLMMYLWPPKALEHSTQAKCPKCQCRFSASVHSSDRINCKKQTNVKYPLPHSIYTLKWAKMPNLIFCFKKSFVTVMWYSKLWICINYHFWCVLTHRDALASLLLSSLFCSCWEMQTRVWENFAIHKVSNLQFLYCLCNF